MKSMLWYNADLHVHTCLSPCAEMDMTPKRIVRAALNKRLGVIAVCDHNSCENVQYVQTAASGTQLLVVGGIEITSCEEVHVLGLFGRNEDLVAMQEFVYDHLAGENSERLYGYQAVVNEFDVVLGFNNRLLIGATDVPLEKVVARIRGLNGLAVAAHIDRESFSVLGQLGFIPDNVTFDAAELSDVCKTKSFAGLHLPLVAGSDAHSLKDIGRTSFRIKMTSHSWPGFVDAVTKQKRQ